MAKNRKRLSESRMHQLWRKSVLIKHGHCCAFCGKYGDDNLECHHIVRRSKLVTRWDWRNGIALCKDCHREAHTKKGEIRIGRIHEFYDYLLDRENIISKDVFVAMGISDAEYYRRQSFEMKKIIGGAND